MPQPLPRVEAVVLAVPPATPASVAPPPPPERTLGEASVEMIRAALEAADGNITVASRRLGISRNTIYRKLRWGQ